MAIGLVYLHSTPVSIFAHFPNTSTRSITCDVSSKYVTLQAKTKYDFHPVNDNVDCVCVKCKYQYECNLFLPAPTGPMVNLRNFSEQFKAKD